MPEPTQANGFAHGRPLGREVTSIDKTVEELIESLPSATRMYPDVYSWQIGDLIETMLRAAKASAFQEIASGGEYQDVHEYAAARAQETLRGE